MIARQKAREIVEALEIRIKEYRDGGRPNPESREIESWLSSQIEAALLEAAKVAWPSKDEIELSALDHGNRFFSNPAVADFLAGVYWLKSRLNNVEE
jgi:hypothetical protein